MAGPRQCIIVPFTATGKPMRTLLLAVATTALVAGCGLIYRQPVHQGNLVQSKNVAQLQEGMSRRQVIVLLGSPPVRDPFHQSRWDYFASQRRGFGKTEIKNLTLWFEGETLVRWEGEYFPDDEERLAREMTRFGNLPRERDRRR